LGTLGEDAQDDFGAVKYWNFPSLLELTLLAGAKLVIEENGRLAELGQIGLDLLNGTGSDPGCWIGLAKMSDVFPHHAHSKRACQLLELSYLDVDARAVTGLLEGRDYERMFDCLRNTWLSTAAIG
jgi:hypothetical protein